MLKVIKETKQITIEQLINRVENNVTLIVFYRSADNRAGIPCFLHQDRTNKSFCFISPITSYITTFKYPTLSECLNQASKHRNLYVLTNDESDKLFKIEPIC